jgi:opacity protein-like surface antigen
MIRSLAVMVFGLILAAAAMPAAAQQPGNPPPPELEPEPADTGTSRAYWGVYGIYASAAGEFRDYVRHGGGMAGFGALPIRPGSPLALRLDLGIIIYGSETQRVCLTNCRIQLDMTTTNTIFFANAGPQIMVPAGGMRPYANAGIGLGAFTTGSEVKGSSSDSPFASTTHLSDATFQWAAGAGVFIPFRRGRGAGLDVGVQYQANGQVEYLTKGDIQDHPDGSISFTPTRSDASLLTFRIGFGAGPRGR